HLDFPRVSYVTYNVYYSYDKPLACVGESSVPLTITIETDGRADMRVVDCKPIPDDAGPIAVSSSPTITLHPGAVIPTTVYRYTVSIGPNAVPRKYLLFLRIQDARKEHEIAGELFEFNVGVRHDGLLLAEDDAPKSLSVWTGSLVS